MQQPGKKVARKKKKCRQTPYSKFRKKCHHGAVGADKRTTHMADTLQQEQRQGPLWNSVREFILDLCINPRLPLPSSQ